MIIRVAENTPRRALPDAPAPASSGAPERARPSRLETWRDRYELVSDILTPQRIGLALAAVVLVVTGLFGGMNAVEEAAPDELPTARGGEPIAVEPMTFTVKSIRHADELRPVARAEPGKTYYFVVFDVTNLSDKAVPAYTLAEALKLDVAGTQTTQPITSLYRVNDSLYADGYQPDVPVSTVAVWEADAAAPVPQEATLTISELTWYEYFTTADEEWQVAEPAVTVTLPIKPLENP